MSLIKWAPMFPFEEFDKLFSNHPGFMPAVDVYEKDNKIMVEMSVPHIDPEKVDISIENNVLYIKGSTEKKTEVEDDNYYRKEISSGSFYRTVQLPADVIAEKTSAVHEDGVLKIAIPKTTTKKSKSIKVKVNKK